MPHALGGQVWWGGVVLKIINYEGVVVLQMSNYEGFYSVPKPYTPNPKTLNPNP